MQSHDKAPSVGLDQPPQSNAGDDTIDEKKQNPAEVKRCAERRRLREERERLLELQDMKRRRRDDTPKQGRRSKEVKGGKTPLKQKVERLRRERKAILDEYGSSGGSLKKRAKKKKRSHGITLPR